jgi:hypothetical protein
VVESNDSDVLFRKMYAKRYDGPTDFKVEYTIVMKDGKVDSSKSKVTFDCLNYTQRTFERGAGDLYTKEDEKKLIKEGKTVIRCADGPFQNIYIYGEPKISEPKEYKTFPIPITDVKLKKDGSVEWFKFKSDVWHPRDSRLNDKGLFGEINLETGKSEFTSKYQFKEDAVIVTWVTVATNKGLFRQSRGGIPSTGPD